MFRHKRKGSMAPWQAWVASTVDFVAAAASGWSVGTRLQVLQASDLVEKVVPLQHRSKFSRLFLWLDWRRLHVPCESLGARFLAPRPGGDPVSV